MVYVIERLESATDDRWVYVRNATKGVVMFSRKRDAVAYVRQHGENYRYRKVVD